MKSRRTLVLLFLALLPVCSLVVAADWPQFRGPQRDGRSDEQSLATAWGEDGPVELWRRDLGAGYSGTAIVGDKVFVVYGEGPQTLAAALEAASGRTLWTRAIGTKWNDNWGDGPRSTPTVDGDLVFVLGARGDLHALSAADGEPAWSRDLQNDFGAKPLRWGVSTSPLVEGDLLIVDVGGTAGVVAFEKTTGKEAWRVPGDKAGYSSPIVATLAGVRQVVAFTGTRVAGIAPADGALLWSFPWKTSYDVNAAAPMVVGADRIFISSAYDVGGAVLSLTRGEAGFEAKSVWKNREMKNKFSSSVLHDGRLYGFDEKTLKCVDAATGETLWRERGLGHGSLIYADGKLIILGTEGNLVIADASPEGFRRQVGHQALAGRCWTAPALASGILYLRNQEEIVAFDLKGE